jgi:D-alanyl-D-alanine carboxypeptidase
LPPSFPEYLQKITLNLKNSSFTFIFLLCSHLLSAQHYVFFLHNKFIEENELDDVHPEYGKAEYEQILDFYTKQNFIVISEKRLKNTDGNLYAQKVAGQIDSLMAKGIKASEITVIGTSKGGYIAQFVSGIVRNKDINYVFIGSCGEEDVVTHPEINFSGNVLSIYEKSDIMLSCQTMKLKSVNTVTRFQEIELNTRLKHGFLFKALPEWLEPSAKWAKQEFDDIESATKTTVGNVKITAKTNAVSNNVIERIDSLITVPTKKPFNGIVLISKHNRTRYVRLKGLSDYEKIRALKYDDQFVIGSVSKQFTAVLLLLEYEKGHVKLNVPIRTYLPELTQSWADTVTVDHLLTHMHGIRALDEPLDFKPGTKYAYSQIGYDLLAEITEKTSGKSFADQSAALFRKCKMYNTFHPDVKKFINLVPGYTGDDYEKLIPQTKTFENYAAAGSFISTAHDLMLWNTRLHEGKILSSDTYKLMVAKKAGAVRNHPIFGKVEYGYGITVDSKDGILQLGQTGFAPGFISMCYYFPKTRTSIIALDNIVWDEEDLQKAFLYHAQMLKMIRESNLVRKK